MNIGYALKILASLLFVAGVARLIAGPGLKQVLSTRDFRVGWRGIAGTCAVACLALRVPAFFMVLPFWAIILSRMFGPDGSGRLPAYALLVCILPPTYIEIEHIGPLNDLLFLTPPRALGIFLLLPEAVRLLNRRTSGRSPSWLTTSDLATYGYALYWVLRSSSGVPISSVARQMAGMVLDTVLPYYVLSRGCIDTGLRHRVLGMLLLGAVYEAFIGMAESASGHYLFSQLQWLYQAEWAQSAALMRGSWLRAEGSFPGPIAFAVLMLFAGGVWFIFKPLTVGRSYVVVGLSLIGGMLASYSRGPMLSGLLMLASIYALRSVPVKRFLQVAPVLTAITAIAWSEGLGDLVVHVISLTSNQDANADFNVAYRQELLSTSLALLRQSPWWGVPNFLSYMEDLRQGEGIIDLVNTYLVVALNVGVVGLVIYLVPFATTLWGEANRGPVLDPRVRREGAVWVALTVGMMAAIFTVSPISITQVLIVWTAALALARLQDGGAIDEVAPAPAQERRIDSRIF